jgi:hypothetical protein
VRSTFLDIALAISGTTLTITAVTQTGDEDTLFIRIP